ncbi:ArsR/SmtB family transcription factor [Streptomyces sp. SBT349]|uniref:ArsR/SmtB family transcription factor n=1 Tax=Streptomyces sp. SBT349 TaxID=1580539 RepID=UPI00066D68EE|nr:helix-turn-helix domain-containing protein [Streptomyces sp. SBT349]
MPFTPSLSGLKALAHPRRLQILERLTRHGPATSALLARGLDLNTGATSYHLRELARHGFVEETEGSGRGRERWWRAVSQDLRLPPRSRQDPGTRAVVDEMNRLAYASDLRLFEELGRAADEEQGAWRDAFPSSRGTIRLTPDELSELFEAYVALLNRYKRDEDATPPGARTVLTRFLAFPVPPERQNEDPPDPAADGRGDDRDDRDDRDDTTTEESRP